ncbi:MAG: hypothetical protein ABFD50_04670 [Smithella sp.]
MKIELYDEEKDCMVEYDLPHEFQLCPVCKGKGTHVNYNIGAITQEEFDNDPQFYEDYRNGVYDVECERCKGLRVIEVVNKRALNSKQKEIFARYQEMEKDRKEFDQEWASEIRMQNAMGGDW